MLKVGITGGIGSGKSYVCRLFQNLGIPLFHADQEMKRLYQEHDALKKQLIDHFGEHVYLPSGEIHIAFLREVLTQHQQREQLNRITHPFVFERFYEWSKQQKAPYVIKEAAILFESGAHKTVDKTIGVFAPLTLRIQRAMHRDQRSEAEILNIINMQLPDAELKAKVDFVVLNDENHNLEQQVMQLHEQLVHIAPHFSG
jgi:dephospho-CoA kinase